MGFSGTLLGRETGRGLGIRATGWGLEDDEGPSVPAIPVREAHIISAMGRSCFMSYKNVKVWVKCFMQS